MEIQYLSEEKNEEFIFLNMIEEENVSSADMLCNGACS